MANVSGICTSFKNELLLGHHNFGTGVIRAGTTADSFKAALYLATASITAATTAYTATGEVNAGSANYAAGGIAVTNATAPTTSGTTAFWTPSASLTWAALTSGGSFDAVLFYNDTQNDKAVAVFNFAAQTITAGTFSLTMPTNDASTGLLRLA